MLSAKSFLRSVKNVTQFQGYLRLRLNAGLYISVNIGYMRSKKVALSAFANIIYRVSTL